MKSWREGRREGRRRSGKREEKRKKMEWNCTGKIEGEKEGKGLQEEEGKGEIVGDHDGDGTTTWKKIKTMIRFSQSESQLL